MNIVLQLKPTHGRTVMKSGNNATYANKTADDFILVTLVYLQLDYFILKSRKSSTQKEVKESANCSE